MKRQYVERLIKGITEPMILYLINEVPMYGYNIIPPWGFHHRWREPELKRKRFNVYWK